MLDMFSNPRAVAVIGASRDPNKLGYSILSNIIQYGFSGDIYPINPKSDEILGLTCYSSVLDVPGPIDLAVIVVPHRFVMATIKECGQVGVRGVIVISSGFRESKLEGVRRERELVSLVKKHGIRLIGPNCLGMVDTHCPLNASFAAGMPPVGQIAFISQSGALCTSILDWALAKGIGFSRFVSLGNKADIDEIDLLEAWESDPHTRVILIYTEGLTDGQRFMQVARRVTKKMPVVAVKSGTTSAGSRAVSSHTGSLPGSEHAYRAAFSQAGVVRAESIEEMFDFSTVFSYQPLLRGNRIAIVTNAGGPGIMATDAVERAGLQMASLNAKTMETLQSGLPSASNIYNPIDVLGDAQAEHYGLALEAVLQDDGVSGVIVILTPQVMTRIEKSAETVGQIATRYEKPVVGCFMGEAKIGIGIRTLNRYRVPNFSFPERAANALRAMAAYYRWHETPPIQVPVFQVDKIGVQTLFEQVKTKGRLSIGDVKARQVMEAYGIPLPRSRLASSAKEAVRFAHEIGFPVVLKIASPDILHKTDNDGIKLDLRTPDEVRDAFDLLTFRATRFMPDAEIWGCQVQEMVSGGREVTLSMTRDPQFGPLMAFGLGGIYETLQDRSFRIAPFSRKEARAMLTEIRTANLLRGVPGEPPADLVAIEDVLLRLSQLVTDFIEIVEMDINPLIVFEKGQGVMGIDMRLVLS